MTIRPTDWRRSVTCPQCNAAVGDPCHPEEHLPRIGMILRGGLAYAEGTVGHDVMCEDPEGRGRYLSTDDHCGCIDRGGERAAAASRLQQSPNRDPWTGEVVPW